MKRPVYVYTSFRRCFSHTNCYISCVVTILNRMLRKLFVPHRWGY